MPPAEKSRFTAAIIVGLTKMASRMRRYDQPSARSSRIKALRTAGEAR
jgi:hypothetical protein